MCGRSSHVNRSPTESLKRTPRLSSRCLTTTSRRRQSAKRGRKRSNCSKSSCGSKSVLRRLSKRGFGRLILLRLSNARRRRRRIGPLRRALRRSERGFATLRCALRGPRRMLRVTALSKLCRACWVRTNSGAFPFSQRMMRRKLHSTQPTQRKMHGAPRTGRTLQLRRVRFTLRALPPRSPLRAQLRRGRRRGAPRTRRNAPRPSGKQRGGRKRCGRRRLTR